jgi:hypothetical protein
MFNAILNAQAGAVPPTASCSPMNAMTPKMYYETITTSVSDSTGQQDLSSPVP